MGRKAHLVHSLLLTVLLVLLSSCDRSSNEPVVDDQTTDSNTLTSEQATAEASSAEEHSGGAVHWFNGTIEQAFAYAKAQNKPLYFYWGAVWCPPCEEVKQTVFKNAAFLAQSELFVPVYLDGDTESAQSWGEHFSVQGYPTMIVFSPQGEELTRIPGGIETQHYVNVLRLTLSGLKNTSQLVETVLQAPAQLSNEDLTQLAFYSWDQGNLDISVEQTPELLKHLAMIANQKENRIAFSRLYFQYLWMAVNEGNTPLTEDEAQFARETITNVLADQDWLLANVDFFLFYAEDIVPFVSETEAQRSTLSQHWIDAVAAIRHSPMLSSAEQLGTWYPQLDLYWINNPDAQALPAGVAQQVKDHVHTVDQQTKGRARQAVINRAYQVLYAAHLFDESKQMVLSEIQKSQSPYYFMSSLAEFAEEEKNYDEAVSWLEKAYNASVGNATRFQWGVDYVSGLVRMKPEQVDRIAMAASGLLDDLDQPADVFSGRNFGRLQSLNERLKEWQFSGNHRTALDTFYARLRETCQATDGESAAGQNCRTLDL